MNTTLNIRIDKSTKAKAMKTFESLGLDMSSAIKMFLKQSVIEQALPFKPSRTPKEIRGQWDEQAEYAIKNSKSYNSFKELIADIDHV